MDKSLIEQKANETLERAECKDSVDAIDVIDVAKKLGFVVGNAGLSEDIDGFIIIEEGKKKILGQETDKLIGVNEADYFAANLLMPKFQFLEKYKEMKKKKFSLDDMIVLLADKFAVTQPMVERRFEELDIHG